MSQQPPQTLPKVLIVDDSRMVRASIIKNLRGRFQTREETDGEAGWEALVVDPDIHLVITDIEMPRLNGYGLLERIRNSRLARVHDLPVVVISGDEDDESREKAHQLGANDFITKGIGATELLARLESLSLLAHTSRELKKSRAALAAQSPSVGQATEIRMARQAEQEMALAHRHSGNAPRYPAKTSTTVVEIDHYEQLVEWHGAHVAQLVTRKLSKILATRVRKADTVAQFAPDQFAILSPGTDLAGCCAFALRLQRAIEKVVMTYREERLRISVTAGVACSTADGLRTVSQLIDLAVQRAQLGKQAGGNCVVSSQGEVGSEPAGEMFRQAISLDHVLFQLKSGAADEAARHLSDVIGTALPLFELIETRLQCGLPLDMLRQHASKGSLRGEEDIDPARTSV